MNLKQLSLSFLFLLTTLSAFQDSDMDGVEDSLDRCSNTPFDVLVEADGCPKSGEKSTQTEAKIEKNSNDYWGKLTLKIGTDISRDANYEDSETVNLYANYEYEKWSASLSNAQSTTKNSYQEENAYSDSDIYLSAGYRFAFPQSSLKFTLGTKIVGSNSDEDSARHQERRGRGNKRNQNAKEQGNREENGEKQLSSSRENDYYTSLDYNYLFNEKQDLFAYGAYTVSGDSDALDYENYTSLSLGTGYVMSKDWYTALSYGYSESIYANSKAEQSLSWFNSYQLSKKIFATASYRYGLDAFSYDHIVSFALGVTFE